jgi:hypothetical protein
MAVNRTKIPFVGSKGVSQKRVGKLADGSKYEVYRKKTAGGKKSSLSYKDGPGVERVVKNKYKDKGKLQSDAFKTYTDKPGTSQLSSRTYGSSRKKKS